MDKKNILILHPGFPGQFGHLAHHWIQEGHDLRIVCPGGTIEQNDPLKTRLENHGWDFSGHVTQYPWNPAAMDFSSDRALWLTHLYNYHALGTYSVLRRFKSRNWIPDVIICHPGWGSHLLVKNLYPQSLLVNYAEYIELAWGPSFHSGAVIAEVPHSLEDKRKIMMDHMWRLQAIELADVCVSPTAWQRRLYPSEYRKKIHIIHEGVALEEAAPFELKDFNTEKIITFSARSLEPARGYHHIVRALNIVMKQDPEVEVMFIGDRDNTTYDSLPPDAPTWHQKFMKENPDLDSTRLHYLGKVPHWTFVKLLQSSFIHVHYNPSSVLSWSCLEAMGQGCYVLASNTGPVEEVIRDGINGHLWYDHQDLASLILRALQPDYDYTRRHLGSTAREHIKARYSHEKGIRNWETFLDQQLTLRKQAP